MSKIVKNGDGTVTMPVEMLKELSTAYTETKKDVELSVEIIAKVLMILGIIQADGNIRPDFRFRHLFKNLTGIITESLTNSSGMEKKFSFVTDKRCLEVIEKYSYMYKASGTAKADKSIVDIEFEML